VWREKNKRLRQEGDQRLMGSKYPWLRHPARFSKKQWRAFEELRESGLKTARRVEVVKPWLYFDMKNPGFRALLPSSAICRLALCH